MADFISALNGTQMDEALLDVAEHNSEAWAVGTRNGVEVQEGDITFQNNSQYYAQLAASQITGDITDAVRWDTDQSTILTDEAKARARNNINAAPYNDVATNLNLLDNPWWGSAEVINQRSATSWTGTSTIYTIDRWKYSSSVSGNSAELRSDGIRFSLSYGSSNFFYTYQILSQPLFNSIKGKVATASVLLSDGTIKSGTTTIPSSGTATFISEGSVTVTINNNGEFTVRILVSSTIRAVKLELCSWSTLANDVPPDKGIELAKCIASTADPSDSYANSGYARSNRNLLDNPFFTVNQRQVTSANFTNAYCVDRWRTVNIMTVNASNTGYIILKNAYANDASEFIQMIPLDLRGKTVTATVKLRDGSIYTKTGVLSESAQWGNLVDGWSLGFSYATSNNTSRFRIYSPNNTTSILYVAAVKLELGSYSTLINDAPPHPAEELAKCQRYFQRIHPAGASALPIGLTEYKNTTSLRTTLFLPVTLRTSPTVALSGNARVMRKWGYAADITAMSAGGMADNRVTLNITVSSLSEASDYNVYLADGAYIDLSADL